MEDYAAGESAAGRIYVANMAANLKSSQDQATCKVQGSRGSLLADECKKFPCRPNAVLLFFLETIGFLFPSQLDVKPPERRLTRYFLPCLSFLPQALNLSRALTWEPEECKITQLDAMLLPGGPPTTSNSGKCKSGGCTYTDRYPPNTRPEPETSVLLSIPWTRSKAMDLHPA